MCLQIPRSLCKSTNKNNKDNIIPPEAITPIVKFPERGNLAEAQDTDFTTAIMNMFKNLKEDMKNAWMKFMKTPTFTCNNKKNLRYGNQIEQRNDSLI